MNDIVEQLHLFDRRSCCLIHPVLLLQVTESSEGTRHQITLTITEAASKLSTVSRYSEQDVDDFEIT